MFSFPGDSFITASLYAHASFNPSSAYKEFTSKFGFAGGNVELAGAVAHLKTSAWTEPIRFQIDRSELLQSGLFLSWTTKLKNWPMTFEMLDSIKKSTDEINDMFLLKFGPLAAI